MPTPRPVIVLALMCCAMMLSCSKRSSEPTAPHLQGPVCDLSAEKISFDEVQLGEWVDSPLVIRNIGGGTLTGTVVDTSNAFLLIGEPGFALAAGESTAVTLRFQPLALGDRVAVVRAGDCAVECTGTGVRPIILACNLDPTTIDFGTVPVGQVVDRTFTLTNQSTSQMTGSLMDTSKVFTVPGSSSYNLSPGQSATFVVRFASSRPGPNACVIQTGQRGCPTVTCSAVAQPICAVSTDRLEFGLVAAGVTVKKSFTITNVGSAPLVGVVGTNGTCDGYHIEGDLISYNLAAGQVLTVTVDFNSFGSEGLFTCTLLTGNPGCPSITCSALAQVPCNCSVGPTIVNFGDVVVGNQSSHLFTISASRGTAIGGVMTVLGDGFLLAPAANPGLTSTALGYAVNGNSQQSFLLIFDPASLGSASAVVAISQTLCTRAGTPCDTIRCSGNGITLPTPPACAASTTNIDFGVHTSGEVRDTTFTLTNTGGGTMSATIHFTESPSIPFAIIGPTSYSLGAGQTQFFTVRYTAPAVTPGHTQSDAKFIDLSTGCTNVNLLTVQGTAVSPPICDLSTTTLDFGTVAVGQSKDLTFDIHNAGAGTLCGSVTEGTTDFSIVQNGSYCITPPGFARVTVRFTPSAVGQQLITISAGPGVTCPTIYARGTGS